MTTLLLLWLRFLLYVLGSLSLLLAGIMIARIELKRKSANEKNLGSFWRIVSENANAEKNMKRLNNFVLVCTGLLVGFVSGYMAREAVQYKHTYSYSNVKVRYKYSDEEYVLVIKNDEYDVQFCPTFEPNFPEGAVIEKLVVEIQPDCWNLSDKKLGYKYDSNYRKEVLDASR